LKNDSYNNDRLVYNKVYEYIFLTQKIILD